MLDTYNEWNSQNPINQVELEPLTKLEQLQEDYLELRGKYTLLRNRINNLIEELENLESQTYVVNKLRKL
jgi:hypothetical protein